MAIAEPAVWRMRYLIYTGIREHGRPPAIEQLAATLALSEDDALGALRELGARHSVVLTDDQRGVVMANPFSTVPTPFRVTANGVDYWASCAWDMLGVPAALGTDNAPAELHVAGGKVHGANGIVHFLKPFRTWYDDIRHT